MKYAFLLFMILALAGSSYEIFAQEPGTGPRVINGVAVPSDFPHFTPTINEETAPGNIFINNWNGSPYIMIYKNDGTPCFYQRVPERSRDFKVQPTGVLSRKSRIVDAYIVLDTNFRNIDTVSCQNGYETDEHGLQLLEGGYAMMIALENKEVDLSTIFPGGNPDANIIGNHVQIIDSRDSVVFEWKCWDHFDIEDSYEVDPKAEWNDYVHMNSTAIDYDDHIVISSRHLSECTKINRETGEIIWRFGGKNNQFEFINDEDQISYQHDFRPVPGYPDHYTLYDNGNQKIPPYSRAVEFYLDTVTMTAEKIWEYRHDPERYSWWMGNVQRLPNGNTLINWADNPLPKATEVTPEGEVVYEADFEHNTPVYRTFRFEWDGCMLEPYLIAEPFSDFIRLIINKFGDEGVDYYNIYAGPDPEQMEWIDSTRNTWADLEDLADSAIYYFLEVTAVDTAGQESPPSNRELVFVRKTKPGNNLILNSDFAQGTLFWTHLNHQGASAEGIISDDVYKFSIQDGGSAVWHTQLFQQEIPLIQGETYLFEWEARAESPRTVEIKMVMDGTPWTNYSRLGLHYITEQYKHFEHTFEMEEPTDLKARLEVNGGASDIDFEIRQLSLKQKVNTEPSALLDPGWQEGDIRCYPNPADQEVSIRFHLDENADISIQLFTLSGQLISKLYQGKGTAGLNRVEYPTGRLSNGTYLVRLSDGKASQYRKMVVLH